MSSHDSPLGPAHVRDTGFAKLVGKPWFWVLFVFGIVTVIIVRAVNGSLPEPPPVLGQVGPFLAVDQDAKTLGSAELDGRLWVAVPVDLDATGACDATGALFGQIQHRVHRMGRSIQLVTVPVGDDSAEALDAWSFGHRGSPRIWKHLAGEADTMASLAESLVGDAQPCTALALVDSRFQVRGRYAVGAEATLDQLLRDIQTAVREMEDPPA